MKEDIVRVKAHLSKSSKAGLEVSGNSFAEQQLVPVGDRKAILFKVLSLTSKSEDVVFIDKGDETISPTGKNPKIKELNNVVRVDCVFTVIREVERNGEAVNGFDKSLDAGRAQPPTMDEEVVDVAADGNPQLHIASELAPPSEGLPTEFGERVFINT